VKIMLLLTVGAGFSRRLLIAPKFNNPACGRRL
jgi:hypothetical protein